MQKALDTYHSPVLDRESLAPSDCAILGNIDLLFKIDFLYTSYSFFVRDIVYCIHRYRYIWNVCAKKLGMQPNWNVFGSLVQQFIWTIVCKLIGFESWPSYTNSHKLLCESYYATNCIYLIVYDVLLSFQIEVDPRNSADADDMNNSFSLLDLEEILNDNTGNI